MLLGRSGGQLQRVHAAVELVLQQSVHHSVPHGQALALEQAADYLESEMRLDLVVCVANAVVAAVLVRVVEHLEVAEIREVGLDLGPDALSDGPIDAPVGGYGHLACDNSKTHVNARLCSETVGAFPAYLL